jgi:hypothetical protein
LQATVSIPLSLTLAVVLHPFRVRSALLLIIGMLVPPLLLALAHNLAIFRVRSKLLAVIIAPALALTLSLTADPLSGTINRRHKRTPAVRTMAGLVQVDSLRDSKVKSLRRIKTTGVKKQEK